MAQTQGIDNSGKNPPHESSQTLEVKRPSLLEQIMALITQPASEDARLAAIMVLDGVDHPDALGVLNRVRAMHQSRSLECQFAELALAGGAFSAQAVINSNDARGGVALEAVPSIAALRVREDWSPGWFAVVGKPQISTELPEVVDTINWLRSLPRYRTLSETEQRRVANLLSSKDASRVYHSSRPYGNARPTGGGYSANYRVAKEAAFVLGGAVLPQTEAALLRNVDFSPSKRHNKPIATIEEFREQAALPESRPSVAWACCHALHDVRMDQAHYSRFVEALELAAFKGVDQGRPRVIPDEVLSAAFILNGQLHEAWRQWVR